MTPTATRGMSEKRVMSFIFRAWRIRKSVRGSRRLRELFVNERDSVTAAVISVNTHEMSRAWVTSFA
jgi:hypothetical protein